MNDESRLLTYDFLLTNIVALIFFIREGIRFGAGEDSDDLGCASINLWKYIAYMFLFSAPTSLALFMNSLLVAEELNNQEFIDNFQKNTETKKKKKIYIKLENLTRRIYRICRKTKSILLPRLSLSLLRLSIYLGSRKKFSDQSISFRRLLKTL